MLKRRTSLVSSELNVLASAVSVLQNATRQTVLQWNPAHCNEEVDRLAKDGVDYEGGHLQRIKNHRVSQGEEDMAETTSQLQE